MTKLNLNAIYGDEEKDSLILHEKRIRKIKDITDLINSNKVFNFRYRNIVFSQRIELKQRNLYARLNANGDAFNMRISLPFDNKYEYNDIFKLLDYMVDNILKNHFAYEREIIIEKENK